MADLEFVFCAVLLSKSRLFKSRGARFLDRVALEGTTEHGSPRGQAREFEMFEMGRKAEEYRGPANGD